MTQKVFQLIYFSEGWFDPWLLQSACLNVLGQILNPELPLIPGVSMFLMSSLALCIMALPLLWVRVNVGYCKALCKVVVKLVKGDKNAVNFPCSFTMPCLWQWLRQILKVSGLVGWFLSLFFYVKLISTQCLQYLNSHDIESVWPKILLISALNKLI